MGDWWEDIMGLRDDIFTEEVDDCESEGLDDWFSASVDADGVITLTLEHEGQRLSIGLSDLHARYLGRILLSMGYQDED